MMCQNKRLLQIKRNCKPQKIIAVYVIRDTSQPQIGHFHYTPPLWTPAIMDTK